LKNAKNLGAMISFSRRCYNYSNRSKRTIVLQQIMKSLKRVFNKIRNENPSGLVIPAFAEALLSRKFSGKLLFATSTPLVDKEEYKKNEKKEIIRFLVELSKRN